MENLSAEEIAENVVLSGCTMTANQVEVLILRHMAHHIEKHTKDLKLQVRNLTVARDVLRDAFDKACLQVSVYLKALEKINKHPSAKADDEDALYTPFTRGAVEGHKWAAGVAEEALKRNTNEKRDTSIAFTYREGGVLKHRMTDGSVREPNGKCNCRAPEGEGHYRDCPASGDDGIPNCTCRLSQVSPEGGGCHVHDKH